MILQEFSNEFDILYNNISSNQAPGLTEYEKSVFLTQAQEETVRELYTGRNSTQNSFEETEELRRCLEDLICTNVLEETSSTEDQKLTERNSYIYSLPEDIMFITYEQVSISKDDIGCGNEEFRILDVYPTTQDEYSKIKRNPFRGPTKSRVIRLDCGDNKVELISNYKINEYKIRYIKKPSPIILEDLEDDLTINNESTATECALNSLIHRTILIKAVNLALQVMYSK